MGHSLPVACGVFTQDVPSSFPVLLCETNFRLDSAPYSAGGCRAALPEGISGSIAKPGLTLSKAASFVLRSNIKPF